MKEVLELSFSGVTILPTILLLLAAVYWVVFLLGFLDLSFLDIDVAGKDIGMDAGHDIGADAGADGHGGHSHGSGIGPNDGGGGFLDFLNLTHVPFMIVFSFFALFFWGLCLIGEHEWGTSAQYISALILLGSLVGAALVAKIITQPMRGIFRKFNDFARPINFRGRTCVLELGTEGTRLGQGDLVVDGKHLRITVRSIDGKRIPTGTTCVIVDTEQGDEPIYLVQALNDDETQS